MRAFYLSALQFFILVFTSQQSLTSQTVCFSDAQSAGMANMSVATIQNSPFSANPAAMSSKSRIQVGLSYLNTFMVNELNTTSAAIVYPGKLGSLGLNIGYFGSSYYNEQKYSLSYSKTLGNKINGGIRFNYFQTDISSEYEKPIAITGDLGILISPIEHLSVGALLINLTGAKYLHYEYEDLKQGVVTGAVWTERLFLISTQVELFKNQPAAMGVGSEINLSEKFDLRLGISSNETHKYTFGFGYGLEKLQADVAFAFHPVLGYSSYISIYYIIGKYRV